jgi:hypothetical protein
MSESDSANSGRGQGWESIQCCMLCTCDIPHRDHVIDCSCENERVSRVKQAKREVIEYCTVL